MFGEALVVFLGNVCFYVHELPITTHVLQADDSGAACGVMRSLKVRAKRPVGDGFRRFGEHIQAHKDPMVWNRELGIHWARKFSISAHSPTACIPSRFEDLSKQVSDLRK